jgi:RNA polymerase sigma factor (TIGR02999 family)
MSDVPRILAQIEQGDRQAAEQLLPLVYEELRRLAAARMTLEQPGMTLSPTALVHEAYLRLVQGDPPAGWQGRGHFFAAAAEAMRRILIERARAKATLKRGAGGRRLDLEGLLLVNEPPPEEILRLDEGLVLLEQRDATAARLVALRFFAGLSHADAAAALGLRRRAADRLWRLARAWLYQHVTEG